MMAWSGRNGGEPVPPRQSEKPSPNDIYDCAGRPGEKRKRNGAPGVPMALGKRFCSSKRGGNPGVFES